MKLKRAEIDFGSLINYIKKDNLHTNDEYYSMT